MRRSDAGFWALIPRGVPAGLVAVGVLGCTLKVGDEELRRLSNGECGKDQKACGEACVSLLDPTYGCGSPTCSPCYLTNATAFCSDTAQCVVDSCNAGTDDCNGDSADGCEIDVAHDPKHCGRCDAQCEAPPHAEAGCAGGVCNLRRCEPGFRDCNGRLADGCEIDLRTDPSNCFECGFVCPSRPHASPSCEDAHCGIGRCEPGFADCNDDPEDGCEIRVSTEPDHCGQCGVKCGAEQLCVEGLCCNVDECGAEADAGLSP